MICTSPPATRRRGFTLVEMLMVLVIMGIMAAMAAPGMTRWLKTVGSRGAVNELVGDVTLARIQAVRRGQTVSLRIIDENTYQVTADNNAGAVATVIKTVNLDDAYRGARLDPDNGRIAFDSRGMYRPNPTSTIDRVGLVHGGVQKNVIVTVVGRVYRE